MTGAATVCCQLAFPFTGAGPPTLTIVTVVLFAATSVGHALDQRGAPAALALAGVAGGVGLLAEAAGLRTGVPFGRYEYAATLGPQLLGVPVVVPLAWLMMAYPALLVGRRLTRRQPVRWRSPFPCAWASLRPCSEANDAHVPGSGANDAHAPRSGWGRGRRLAGIGVGAWALASWDVFLDPQMVDAGHWRWLDPAPSLPGVDGIPLTNFAGWLLVAVVLIAMLDAALPAKPTDDRLPVALYLWTYGSSVLAHLVFFGRPSVAVAGGIVMGLVAVPLAAALHRGARRGRSTQASERSGR